MVNTRQTSFLRLASFFLTEHFVLACREAFLFDLSYSAKMWQCAQSGEGCSFLDSGG